MAQSSWHREYLEKANKQLVKHVEGKRTNGWLSWFAQQHPVQFEKYETAINKINKLWGRADAASLEEFKAAVKCYVDACRWAVQKFNAVDEVVA